MRRIKAICELILPCDTLADIGCDHGYVAAYAAGICKTVIAADVSEVSLNKAKRTLSRFTNAKFYLSDGFSGIEEKADTVVITGMGGKKITEILDGAGYKPNTLILGPQHDVDFVREYLVANGYRISADFMVTENGKFYDFIRAALGEREELSLVQLSFGVFYKEKNTALRAYAEKKLAALGSYAPSPHNENMLSAVKEVLKWQK